MKTHRSSRRRLSRRAAVAVEFAFVAPVLIGTAIGIIELTRAYDAQNLLETAAREGARFASMDRDGMLAAGQTTNSKMIADVKKFLASSGIAPEVVQVTVTDAETGGPFDLDDAASDLKLFKVEITAPYSSVSYLPVSEANDFLMTASIIFRNGRATLSQ
jgi:Flp pilus assembly protein TadG